MRQMPVAMLNRWSRKLHRWGALLIILPGLVIFVTGVLLQLKKHWAWVQPPTLQGTARAAGPLVSFDRLLEIARAVPEAQVSGWTDIDRLDVQPSQGIIKIHPRNRVEVQVDAATGTVLQTMYRRSDLLESLHDGSWFHSDAKLWIFLPAGAVLLGLWVTGVFLWVLPHWVRMKRRRRIAEHARTRG